MQATALIPAHNEAATIADTVRSVLALTGVDRVIVIDDGSSDQTESNAAAAGAEVVRVEVNRGKGAALNQGLESIGAPEVLLLLDGDLADTAGQAELLIAPIASGEADMTIATFPPPEKPAGFGAVKRLANRGINRLGGEFEASAPLSGQRAIRGSALEKVIPFESGYGVEVALTIRALREGLRVVEVPTTMAHAATGRDIAGFLHRGRQFIHVMRALRRLG